LAKKLSRKPAIELCCINYSLVFFWIGGQFADRRWYPLALK
jgi:hypothetical protein